MHKRITPADRQVVTVLRRRQETLGLTDAEMARELGISRALWSLTRKGEKAVGLKLAQGILRRFPTLQDDVLLFLQEKVTLRTVDGAHVHEEARPS